MVASMSKRVGNKKGKQTAKRPAPKGPAPVQPGEGDQVGKAGQQAILEQIEALERARGLPAGGSQGVPGKRDRITWQVSQQFFHSQIYQRLMSVMAKVVGTPGFGTGEDRSPSAAGFGA